MNPGYKTQVYSDFPNHITLEEAANLVGCSYNFAYSQVHTGGKVTHYVALGTGKIKYLIQKDKGITQLAAAYEESRGPNLSLVRNTGEKVYTVTESELSAIINRALIAQRSTNTNQRNASKNKRSELVTAPMPTSQIKVETFLKTTLGRQPTQREMVRYGNKLYFAYRRERGMAPFKINTSSVYSYPQDLDLMNKVFNEYSASQPA